MMHIISYNIRVGSRSKIEMQTERSQPVAVRGTGVSPEHRYVSDLMQDAEQTPGAVIHLSSSLAGLLVKLGQR